VTQFFLIEAQVLVNLLVDLPSRNSATIRTTGLKRCVNHDLIVERSVGVFFAGNIGKGVLRDFSEIFQLLELVFTATGRNKNQKKSRSE
jgi:hypothetical protein